MSKHTRSEKDRAERKVNIAIDKIVDLQDMGFGCDATSRILDMLNSLRNQINNQE